MKHELLIEEVGSEGIICPWCKQDNADALEWGAPEWTSDGIAGDISCGNCGCKWSEVCTRTSLVLIHEGDEISWRPNGGEEE